MKMCGCEEIQKAIKEGSAQVVDVREAQEYAAERVADTVNHPLSELNNGNVKGLTKNKPVYLICKSGARAKKAGEKLTSLGFDEIYCLANGMEAWKAGGKPLVKGECRVWSLDRQVRFTAGLLVLCGILLSIAVHSFLIAIPIFVAGGLVISAITDTCPMALGLAKMPWNRPRKASES